MENCMHSFEEISDVYSGFPLKEGFLQAGTQALMAFEEDLVQAPVLKEGKITFTVAVAYYYSDEEMMEIAWACSDEEIETVEEARKAFPDEAETVHAMNVTILVKEDNGKLYVDGVDVEYCVLDSERKSADLDVYPEAIEDNYAYSMPETFLDAAVDPT